MKTKLKPSEQKSNFINEIISGHAGVSLKELLIAGVEHLMQKGLEGEVTDFLGRAHYEPKSEKEGQREGYRNGYYPRTAKTAEGRLNLKIPRVRGTQQPYNSELLNRLSELEAGLYRLSTEMYVRGL
ncbi:transposase [Chloroherpeton thalassium]|uniref:transposase n=1 Tax=Chloroherpeton thalassium TaxID=100716 RepID=UPI000673DEA2|nr:transposase [Chloroherpeton thalassium]